MSTTHRRAGKFLLLWGCLLIAGTVVLAGLGLGRRVSRQSILVLVAGSVAGGGVTLSGLWAHRSALGTWVRLPAFTLITVGAILAVGSPVVFRPWSYDGLAAGVAVMFTAVVIALGVGCLFTGGYCLIRETVRPAVVMTAVVTGLGWGYVFQLHQYTSGLSEILLGMLFIAVAIVPLAVILRWSPVNQGETGTDTHGQEL